VKGQDGEELGYSLATVEWDDGISRPLTESMLDDLELAYAITIHKSQGSQWPRIIVALTKNKLLDRTLVYTAITRAQKQVVIVGDPAATRISVENVPKMNNRRTGLQAHMQRLLTEANQGAREVSEVQWPAPIF
jgi:exodeoxyribonuclease V alpha subunit